MSGVIPYADSGENLVSRTAAFVYHDPDKMYVFSLILSY
jgi:hypothetical protein